jgi:hypothetical protein
MYGKYFKLIAIFMVNCRAHAVRLPVNYLTTPLRENRLELAHRYSALQYAEYNESRPLRVDRLEHLHVPSDIAHFITSVGSFLHDACKYSTVFIFTLCQAVADGFMFALYHDTAKTERDARISIPETKTIYIKRLREK